MRRYRWTLYEGDRIIDSGELEAKNEREAMGLVFLDHADSVRSDGNYRVVVGDTSMSSEGRDFTRSAAAAGWGKDQKENQLARGRYLFDDPVLDRILEPTEKAADAMRDLGVAASDCGKTIKDCAEKFDNQQTFGGYDSDRQREFDRLLGSCGPIPPCSDGSTNHDMNDETAHPQTGEIHAQCRHCGLIDPVGTGRILRDPYGGPSMNPLPRGTDRIVGRALNSGEKGDVIEVTLNPEYGGGRYTSEAGGRVAVNEGVRIGASGMVYPPPRNELPAWRRRWLGA